MKSLKTGLFAVVLFSFCTLAQSDTALTITEVMFNAPAGANQFVELFNLSYADTIDLEYYQIQYENTTPNYIVNAGYGTKLAPRQYAVVMQAAYYFSTGVYKNSIPATALKLKIYDLLFGTVGMISTAPRTISLLDKNKRLIDAYTYSVDQTTVGISDEKYLLSKDNSGDNWRNSLRPLGSPGGRNTVTPVIADISVSLTMSHPFPVFTQESVPFLVTLKNKGIQSASGITLAIYKDSNLDSVAQTGERIAFFENLSIAAGDSLLKTITVTPQPAGVVRIIANANLLHDEFPQDNISMLTYTVYTQEHFPSDVVINEIMYTPANGEPEWIELYNRTAHPVDLKKWKLADAAHSALVSPASLSVPANGYLVLAKDSTIKEHYPYTFPFAVMQLPPLNNSGDNLMLQDSMGVRIDTVSFGAAASGGYGRSLEKIIADSSGLLPANWQLSVSPDHATPGKKNSVTPKDYDAALFLSPYKSYDTVGAVIPFSGYIRNTGRNAYGASVLSLYHDRDMDGNGSAEELISLLSIPAMNPRDSLAFRLLSDTLKTGIQQYLLVLYLNGDEDTTNNFRVIRIPVVQPTEQRGDVLVNEIQYAPPSGQGEWFELFNNSEKQISLLGYHFADARDTVRLFDTQTMLAPHGYLIIAKDSTLAQRFKLPSPLFVNAFPVLNNDGDNVILMDSLYRVIDSLTYPNRGDTKGHSLERISVLQPSTAAANWSLCKNKYGISPGAANSVSIKKCDVAISPVLFSPAQPLPGNSVTVSVMLKNQGTSTAANIATTFQIHSDASPVDSSIGTVLTAQLAPGDSLQLSSPAAFTMFAKTYSCTTASYLAGDEDTTNNTASAEVSITAPSPPVLINEVLFAPAKGMPEWVELYNNSADTANLKGWTVSDMFTSPQTASISAVDALLYPRHYCILARDTLPAPFSESNAVLLQCQLPSLNDDKDGIIIKDKSGRTIDSLLYSASWRTKAGRSIERQSPFMATSDSANWLFSYAPKGATPGFHNANDSLRSFQGGVLMVNELLYDPGDSASAFIEFYNASQSPISVTGFSAAIGMKHLFYLADTSTVLPPGVYYVLAEKHFSPGIFSWLNTYEYAQYTGTDLGLSGAGASICVHDGKGNLIDSVYYLPTWQSGSGNSAKQHSLEKISPTVSSNDSRHWVTCSAAEWSTPGKQNSVKSVPQLSGAALQFSPNPFSPDGDGFEDVTTISLTAPYSPAAVSITLFDDKGRKVRTLINNEQLAMPAAIVFDGKNDEKNFLRMGMYIVLVELSNPVDGRRESRKGVLVVARKLK
jgi:hypothetical protein